jgi:hypothetical protein
MPWLGGQMTLERWDLAVDLRSVVEVVVVFAGSGEGELDAVAAHAVVACEQSHRQVMSPWPRA